MVTKIIYPQRVQDSDTDFQYLDEAEETLSLCDLPKYNDAADWEDDFSKQNQSRTSEDEDDFEFLSPDFSASTTRPPAEKSIIFCGKVISYKEAETQKPENKSIQQNTASSSTMFRSVDGSRDVAGCRSRDKGLWKLFEALGCRGRHANNAVVPRGVK